MPQCAAFIDQLRAGFGSELINDIIRRGMRGEPVFHATENGHTLGTPVYQGVRICRDARGNSCNLDDPDAPKEARRSCQVAWLSAIEKSQG